MYKWSVLRIEDVVSSDSQLLINNATFDSNFAYGSFANIIISKVSDPKFSSMLDCLHVGIRNSTCIKAHGCPGSYGNNLFLCYWDSRPSVGSLSNYSLDNKLDEMLSFWSSESPNIPRIQVIDSIFECDLLAVSNSLAIIGSPFTLVKGNIFQGNGGTTAERLLFFGALSKGYNECAVSHTFRTVQRVENQGKMV